MEYDMKRVARAQRALHATPRYKDGSNNVKDMLLDLLHYAEHHGVYFEMELGSAQEAFRRFQDQQGQ